MLTLNRSLNVFFAWFLLLPCIAHAVQPPNKLQCYSTTFEPFVIEKNGEIFGVDVDIIRMAGKELGIDIQFALMPWVRLEQALKAGKVQCVAAYFRTPEREAYMHFTNVPLHITAYTLFIKKGHAPSNTRIDDINGWTVGVNRGFKTTPEFEEAVNLGHIKKFEINNTPQGFTMLNLGRLDAVLTNFHVGEYIGNAEFPEKFTALKPSIRSTPAYFVLAKKPGFDKLVMLFDEALFRIMVNGRYQAVFDKYMK